MTNSRIMSTLGQLLYYRFYWTIKPDLKPYKATAKTRFIA